MDIQQKFELGERFRHSPLMQLLIFNKWARVLLIFFLLMLLSIVIILPKIWRVSPPAFQPKVRISVLDMLQAHSLKRKAEKAVATGKIDEALYAWTSAWYNHPCDGDLSRGFLRTVLKAQNREQYIPTIYSIAHWLLRLSQTNQADLELCADVLHAGGLDDEVVNLLKPFQKQLSGPLAIGYLKALFNQDQIPQFKETWGLYQGKIKTDQELELVHQAFLAGWSSGHEARAAQTKLEEAAQQGPLKKLANHLLMRIAFHKSDETACERALTRLSEGNLDLLADHLIYWNLLLAMGQRDKMLALVQNSAIPPKTAADTTSLSGIYLSVGQTNQAVSALRWHLDRLGYSFPVAMLYADILVKTQDWQELNNLALRLRGLEGLNPSIELCSRFLEGRAELGRGRREYAEVAFDKLLEINQYDPGLGIDIGYKLMSLGFPSQARSIFSSLEAYFQNVPEFWIALSVAAGEAKDAEIMEHAAQKAYGLAPQDPVIINNYAATLLSLRKKPAEAIQLTLQLIGSYPESAIFKLNHAEALIANRRLTEAGKFLSEIATGELGPAELTQYHYNWLQFYAENGQADEARRTLELVDQKKLFPAQLAWLQEIHRKLTPQ